MTFQVIKKRHLVWLILMTMLISLLNPVPMAASAPAVNEYGHEVTYSPYPLNVAGKEVMFFDYSMQHYAEIADKSYWYQRDYLEKNNMDLNQFGKLYASKGDVYATDTFTGSIHNRDNEPYSVKYDFGDLLVYDPYGSNKSGNIRTMLTKGDISFAFAYKQFLRQYDRSFPRQERSSIAEINMFNTTSTYTGESGNHNESILYNSKGTLNLSGNDTWKPWDTRTRMKMTLSGDSYNNGPVDTNMFDAVLLGRDSKGPGIKAVNISWNEDGPFEYLGNGDVSGWDGMAPVIQSDIGKTLYIAVLFDEPVKFKAPYHTPDALADLKLNVQTIGKDGTSAGPLTAHFLKYAPTKNTSVPAMIFEYKIQDPKDESSIRKDIYYKFSTVRINSAENSIIYEYLTDMAGNAFSSENGLQKDNYTAVINQTAYNSSGRRIRENPFVDMEPLEIESVTIAYNGDEKSEFLPHGDYIYVTVNMNKLLKNVTGLLLSNYVPEIELNIQDKDNNYIVPKLYDTSETRASTNGPLRTSITYRAYIPYYVLSSNEPVAIRSVSTEGKTIVDYSGYALEASDSIPAVNKNYYVDVASPNIEMDITKVEGTTDIMKIQATVTDDFLYGRDSTVSITTDLDSDEPLSYQVSTTDEYSDTWATADEGKVLSINAPLVPLGTDTEKKVYVFVKLPVNRNTQMTKMHVRVLVADEAGNTGADGISYTFTPPYDTRIPELSLVRRYNKIGAFGVLVKVSDISPATYEYAWLDGYDAEEPNSDSPSWIAGGSIEKTAEIDYNFNDNGLTGNQLYKRTLWVKVTDASGNTDAQKLNFTYDNRYAEIIIDEISPAASDTEISGNETASATVSFNNITEYAYDWIEWSAEFEKDGGEAFKEYAKNYYNQENEVYIFNREDMTVSDYVYCPKTVLSETPINIENITFTLTGDTDVRLCGEYGNSFSTFSKAEEISGPIVLVICGKKDNYYSIEFVKFNTRYTQGNYEFQQIRFSTNDSSGNRIDRVRMSNSAYNYGFLYPEKLNNTAGGQDMILDVENVPGASPTALNCVPLYDYAEAEFIIRDDRAIGLEDLDLAGNSKILLKKVVFDSDGSMQNAKSGDWTDGYDYAFSFGDESIIDEEIIQTFPITEDMLTLVSESKIGGSERAVFGSVVGYYLDYRFTVPIDISSIEPMAYDQDGHLIRYEFWIESTYQDGTSGGSELLSMFAFNNRLPELTFDSVQTDNQSLGEAHTSIAADLAVIGGEIIDNTVSAARVTCPGESPKAVLKVDMPDNAYNMLANYSVSSEVVDYPWSITPGHKYTVYYGTKDDLTTVENSFYPALNGKSTQCTDGTFILGDITMNDGETLTLYYRLYNEATGDFSPIYRLDIIRDDVPPEIILNVSETRATNADVTVQIESITDSREIDGYYIIDTPEDAIDVTITATYNDGSEVEPEDGKYVFSRNGSFEVTAVDKAGNVGSVVHVVDNIDCVAPSVTGTPIIDTTKGKFTLNADVDGDDAVSAYISFNSEYAALLSDDTDEETWFPINGSTNFGATTSIFDKQNGKIALEVYAKSDAYLASAKLLVMDAAGNVGEFPMQLNLQGIAPTVTNENKTYVYGEPLTFSVPVRLQDIVGDQTGYAAAYNNLPIYTDGAFTVSYTDLFGRSYTENITADIFGAAYKHNLALSPATPTKGPVTATIDTDGYAVTVVDGEDANHKAITVSDNGMVSYTIVPDDKNISAKTFTIPVTNIDKITPTAVYRRMVNGEEIIDENENVTVIGSVTYEILGFSESDVTLLKDDTMTVTFTGAGEHTFSFVDAAGNEGALTVSEQNTSFQNPVDLNIDKYRLTYTLGGNSADSIKLGYHDSDEEPLILKPANQDIAVLVQALNAAGDVIPSAMTIASSGENVQYYLKENTVVFTKDATTTVTLKTASSSKDVVITVPNGTIDKTAPSGSVKYVMLSENETLSDGTTLMKGAVKAYLVTTEQNIQVTGDGIRQDDEGKYFIYFSENGSGVFYLTDRAGNTGTVVVGAYNVDINGPVPVDESWYSGIAAKSDASDGTSGNGKEEVLSTITNNSIRLFFTFDELIRQVDVTAYADNGITPIADTAPYISYTHSANTLTVEFKQNCQARIEVFDIRGNSTVLWRPEDGPVSVIDKDAPTYQSDAPIVQDNKVSITYRFDEVVTSTQEKTDYLTEHTVVFESNGIYLLTFADRAGNVVTITKTITEIDEHSPEILYALEITPDNADIIYSDVLNTQVEATSGNVEIAIAAHDPNGSTIQVINRNKPDRPLPLIAPTIGGDAQKTYTDAVVVQENGIYEITAKDDYGNTNIVYVKIDFIDKTPPAIAMTSTKALTVQKGMTESELRTQVLDGITAHDDRDGDLTLLLTVDVSQVNLNSEGSYTVTYTVKDRLNNISTRNKTVVVRSSAQNYLLVNGQKVFENDIHATTAETMDISCPKAGYILYAAEGYKTQAQMKYFPSINGQLSDLKKGYYTILARDGDRNTFLVYVYVY